MATADLTIEKPDSSRYLKALIYAPAGNGKTYFLGTAQDDPRTSPTLFLDFEAGVDTLVGRDIDVVHITGWETYNKAYQLAATGRYRSVCLDSLTEVQLFAMRDLIEKEGSKRRDPDLMEQRDYGKILSQMQRFVREWRNLPCHIFMSALAKETIDPYVGTLVVPKFSGQFSEDASATLSVVAYLALTTNPQTNKTERVLLLKNQPKFRVKTRTPYRSDVPDAIPNPTVSALLDVLHYKAEDDEADLVGAKRT